MSNHPSENTPSPPREVEAGTDPILIWYCLAKPRMDAALAKVDQAYRDAKMAAVNVDTANRKAAKERREQAPLGDDTFGFNNTSDAVHRTHLRAMEIHASIATGLASSIRDVLSMQQIELPEMVIEP